jgi:hypothetical protein
MASVVERGSAPRRVVAQTVLRAVPNLALGAVAPAVCFLVGRHLWGLAGAIGLAMGWAVGCQGIRWLGGRRVSGLLLVCLIEMVVRASVALLFRSATLYFVAPIVFTALTSLVWLGCPQTSKKLITLVVHDGLPDSVVDVTDVRLVPLLRRISIAYGVEQLVVALVSLIMIVKLPVTDYVAVHAAVSWLVLGIGVVVSIPFLRGDVRAALGRRDLKLSAA